MEHNERTYFDESEYDDVKGFTVLRADSGEYHIAEKWLKGEGEDDVWLDYWVPESDLLERVEAGHCEPKGTLTDEQFSGVCQMVGWYTDDSESEKATA